MGLLEFAIFALMLLLAAAPLLIFPRLYSAGANLATGKTTAKRVPMPPYMRITGGVTIAFCQLFLFPHDGAGFSLRGFTFESLLMNTMPAGWWIFVLWSLCTGIRDARRKRQQRAMA